MSDSSEEYSEGLAVEESDESLFGGGESSSGDESDVDNVYLPDETPEQCHTHSVIYTMTKIRGLTATILNFIELNTSGTPTLD
jgi:hypothetical protein